MRFRVLGMFGSQYFFLLQNGQFYFSMNNGWVPCGIQGIRNVTPQGVSFDIGQPLLVYFADSRLNFYTEPVKSFEVII